MYMIAREKRQMSFMRKERNKMKKRKICISVMIMMVIGVTVLAAAENKIEANIVNYMIVADYAPMNDYLGDPIISYKDRTYVSLRDYANYYDKDIKWDEKSQEITMQDKRGEMLIKDEKTAETICKAIIQEHYADRITDKTIYSMCAISTAGKAYYELSVKFESTDVEDENVSIGTDVSVWVQCYTGEITIKDYKDNNQNPHKIQPRERADN